VVFNAGRLLGLDLRSWKANDQERTKGQFNAEHAFYIRLESIYVKQVEQKALVLHASVKLS
jgi:hypothetical protein